MKHIRAITLDLDDTLWDVAPVIQRAEQRLWAWLESRYPRIGEHWDNDRLAQLRGELAGRYPQRAHDFRFLRKTVLREVALDCGYSDELVEPAFSVFDDARNEVELYPDVPTALDWLAAHYRIIAVTNGNANLATIGIDHYFDDIVASADIGCAKPARRIFAEATRRAGTKACCVLHVGDHPRTDIAGAREAGLATAWMNRRNDKWPEDLSDPDATLADMSDLCRLLQAVSGPT